MSRPKTVALMLDEVSKWLDLSDRAYEFLAMQQGRELHLGRSVQGDLLLLAEWLRQHPDVDAQMYAVLDAVEAL